MGLPLNMKSKDIQNDPDYEEIHVSHRDHELETIKNDAKEATIKKIRNVINNCFTQEIENKESELFTIQKTLFEAKSLMDQLRACIVTKYYSRDILKESEDAESPDWLHQSVKNYSGKAPVYAKLADVQTDHNYPILASDPLEKTLPDKTVLPPRSQVPEEDTSSSQLSVKRSVKIVVGNISKYILNEERNSSKDQATHKWMIYVRPQDSHTDENNIISRIIVFLHPSYKPNDLVEVSKPPFCVCRRGWGEFPIRVQIHFHDPRNRPIDVIHQLKLDKTFTGLQTLGGETVVEVKLFITNNFASVKSSSTVSTSNLAVPTTLAAQHQNAFSTSFPPTSLNDTSSTPDSVPMEIDISSPDKTHLLSEEQVQNSVIKLEPESFWDKQQSSCAVTKEENAGVQFSAKNILLGVPSDLNINPFIHNHTNDSKTNSLLPICDKNSIQVLGNNFISNSFDTSCNNYVTNSERTAVNVEPVLKIISKTPIMITVKPRNAQGGCVQQDIVHYFEPNENGECYVPVRLIQPNNKGDTCDFPWRSKARQFESKLQDFITILRMEEYKSLHEVMLHLIKLFPLIDTDPCFPYCAASTEAISKWTIGRKLAAEWQRSCHVHKALKRITSVKNISEEPWTVKSIFKWARDYGYSNSIATVEEDGQNLEKEIMEVSSLSSTDQLLNNLEETQLRLETERRNGLVSDEEPSEILDVVSVAQDEGPPLNSDFKFSSPSVGEEGLSEVKEVLLKACNEFLKDILHQSLGESGCRQGSNRTGSISGLDVYSAIQNLSFCDFLTNKYMGIEQL